MKIFLLHKIEDIHEYLLGVIAFTWLIFAGLVTYVVVAMATNIHLHTVPHSLLVLYTV